MSGSGFDYGCESYDEHGMPEQLDASTDAVGAVVRVAGLAVRDGLAAPSFSQGTLAHAWRAHPTCSDFAARSSQMQMR